jgi:hypothetical protein
MYAYVAVNSVADAEFVGLGKTPEEAATAVRLRLDEARVPKDERCILVSPTSVLARLVRHAVQLQLLAPTSVRSGEAVEMERFVKARATRKSRPNS